MLWKLIKSANGRQLEPLLQVKAFHCLGPFPWDRTKDTKTHFTAKHRNQSSDSFLRYARALDGRSLTNVPWMNPKKAKHDTGRKSGVGAKNHAVESVTHFLLSKSLCSTISLDSLIPSEFGFIMVHPSFFQPFERWEVARMESPFLLLQAPGSK